MIRNMPSAAMLVVVTALGAGTATAAPADALDWNEQRIVAAQQTAAENAYRWEHQERHRLEQERLEAQQTAENARQAQLRERVHERHQSRTGFSAFGTNAAPVVGARAGGGKGGR